MFVLFVPPLLELLNQSLARLTYVTNNYEVKLVIELKVVLSGKGLSKAIGDLISGRDLLNFNKLILNLFSSIIEGDVDMLRIVAIISLLLRYINSQRVIFVDDRRTSNSKPELSSNPTQVDSFASSVGQSSVLYLYSRSSNMQLSSYLKGDQSSVDYKDETTT